MSASRAGHAEVVLVVGEPRSGKGVLVKMISNELKSRGYATLTLGTDLEETAREGRLTWLREALRKAAREGNVRFIVMSLRGRKLEENSRLSEEEMDILRYSKYVIICTREDGGQARAWKELIESLSPEVKVVASLTSVFPDPSGSKAWWVDVGGVISGKISHLDEEAYLEGRIPTVSKRIVRSVARAILKRASGGEVEEEEEGGEGGE